MRRLARRLFTLCSAVSLGVSAGMLLVSWASYHDGDIGLLADAPVCVRINRQDLLLYDKLNMSRPRWSVLGVTYRSGQQFGEQTWTVTIPLAVPVLLGAVAPALWVASRGRRGRRERRIAGLCPSCGYDLRASPERCSECGAAAKG